MKLLKGKRTLVLSLVAVAAVSTVAATIAIGQAGDPAARANPLNRYAANFTGFGFELATEAAPAPDGAGGQVIYDQDVIADKDNVLFVTISATGDQHDGRREMLACLIDDAPCNPGAGDPSGGAPTGWFTAGRHENYNDDYTGDGYVGDGEGGAGDLHDNAIYYTWCTPVSPSSTPKNIKVKFASAPSPDGDIDGVNNVVFLEAVHFYIDGARIRHAEDRCTEQSPPLGAASAAGH
jgi:hypothetical protein